MNQNIKVEVIIPTYKRSVFLTRAIESVLSQTYPHINAIVVDDNNLGDEFSLHTQKVMEAYEENKRVKYIKHKINKNGAAARNTGIKSSKADYIAFLDDDDLFLPDKIQNQLNVLVSKDTTYGGSFCFHVRRYKRYAYRVYNMIPNKTDNYCFEFLSGITSMPSSTLLIKREVFDEVGLFDETFIRHQDLEFLVRFYRKYKMVISPYYDVYMQIEGFRNYPNSKQAFSYKEKFLGKYQKDIDLFTKQEQRAIYKSEWFEVACLFLKDRNIKTAKKLFKQYIFVDGKSDIRDYLRITFFLLSGYLPFLKKLTAYILGVTKYKKFSKIKS